MPKANPPATERRDLLVSGHINVDHFLSVEEFPARDRTVPILSQRRLLGGTAANIARVASSYGVETGLVSRIGAGFPRQFRAALESSRLDLGGVETVRDRPTPACFILVDAHHEQRTLIEQGPMGSGGRGRAPPIPLERIRSYSWLHLTTGDPAWHLALARAARASGTLVAADPAQEIHYRWDAPKFRRLLEHSELLFGNDHEIERATKLAGVRRPADLVEHVPLIVQTHGRRGVVAFSRIGTTRVPALRPKRIVSLVGGGDAFRAGFYAGWFDGQPLENCLTAGVRSATRWIEGRSVPSIVEGPETDAV